MAGKSGARHLRTRIGRRLPALLLVCAAGAMLASSLTMSGSARAAGTVVVAAVQTPLMAGAGDVADDSAVYVNGDKTWVIADDKDSSKGGVYVYDVNGNQVGPQYPVGRTGNVDLRDGVPFNGTSIVLVGANNRKTNKLNLWSLNPQTGKLTSLTITNPAISSRNYGFCLGMVNRVPTAIVTRKDGKVDRYELTSKAKKLTLTLKQTFTQTNSTEGCVVDDATGALYVAEDQDHLVSRTDARTLYRYDLAGGGTRSIVDVSDGTHLTGDVEGLALARYGTSTYLFASSQGSSQVAVYDVTATPTYLTNFAVGASTTIDEVGLTDGISIGSGYAGPQFPNGLLVAHDGTFAVGRKTSNLKFVDLAPVLAVLTQPEPAPSAS